MNSFKRRHIILLEYLYSLNKPISSEDLANVLGVSSRTIRNDFAEINELLKERGSYIQSKTGSGYALIIEDEFALKELVEDLGISRKNVSKRFPISHQRAHYIIRRLLLSKDYVKIDQLADELFTNRTTVTYDLHLAEKLMLPFQLTVDRRSKYGLKLVGEEKHIRSCIFYEYEFCIENELNVAEEEFMAIFSLDAQMYEEMKQAIIDSKSVFNPVEFSEKSIQALVKMYLIAMQRMATHPVSFTEQEEFRYYGRGAHYIAKYMTERMEEILKVEFNHQERIYFTIMVVAFRSHLTSEYLSSKKSYLIFLMLSENLIEHICKTGYFRRVERDVELREALALHLEAMLVRCRYALKTTHYSTTPKRELSLGMELAVQCADYLQKANFADLGIDDHKGEQLLIDEDEIAELALFFYSAIDRYKISHPKKNALIISNVNKVIGDLTRSKLLYNFAEYIDNVDVMEIYDLERMDDAELLEYDFIMTEANIDNEQLERIQAPIFPYSLNFEEAEKSKLANFLRDFELMREDIYDIFNARFYFTNIKIRNKEEGFAEIYNHLKGPLGLPYEFLENMVERENLISSEIGRNTARIMPTKVFTKQAFVSIFILDKPILWRFSNVQIIIVWNLGSEDSYHNSYFESGIIGGILNKLFGSNNVSKSILQNQDYTYLEERIEIALKDILAWKK